MLVVWQNDEIPWHSNSDALRHGTFIAPVFPGEISPAVAVSAVRLSVSGFPRPRREVHRLSSADPGPVVLRSSPLGSAGRGSNFWRGADALGYATQRWTAERIRRPVWEHFGVRFHVHHVPKLLRQCGWSYQRPTGRAAERDEQEVQRWLRQEWPRIKKKPKGKRPR